MNHRDRLYHYVDDNHQWRVYGGMGGAAAPTPRRPWASPVSAPGPRWQTLVPQTPGSTVKPQAVVWCPWARFTKYLTIYRKIILGLVT